MRIGLLALLVLDAFSFGCGRTDELPSSTPDGPADPEGLTYPIALCSDSTRSDALIEALDAFGVEYGNQDQFEYRINQAWGTIERIAGFRYPLALPGAGEEAEQYEAAFRDFITENPALFITEESQWTMVRHNVDDMGNRHARFEFAGTVDEYHLFVPLQILFHTDAAGNLRSVNGDDLPLPSATTTPDELLNEPAVSAAVLGQAVEYVVWQDCVMSAIEQYEIQVGDEIEVHSTSVIFDSYLGEVDTCDHARIVYEVWVTERSDRQVTTCDPSEQAPRGFIILLDAVTGEIMNAGENAKRCIVC